MGGEDPIARAWRVRMEISHLTWVFRSLIDDLARGGVPGPDDLMDLRRVLYGLQAIPRLHFAQEERGLRVARGRGRRPTREPSPV